MALFRAMPCYASLRFSQRTCVGPISENLEIEIYETTILLLVLY
jgi:hypothetical protein